MRAGAALGCRLERVAFACPAHVAAIGCAEMHRHDQCAAPGRALEHRGAGFERPVGPQAVAVVPV